MKRGRAFVCLCIALLAGACATRNYDRSRTDAPVRSAVEEPFYDLSLMRETPPPVLAQAAEAPFRFEDDCAALRAEIAALDAVLGPDIDVSRADSGDGIDATELLTGAIGGAWSLPYRSIIRRISGANHRERALREAILAGMVRRGLLKGAALRACGAEATDPAGPPH